ncbi:MAG: hypothetical protein ABI534_03265 [Chloroflexota bacterium]
MSVRMVVQHGPKEKRAVAIAIDWPGWSRGAKTPDAAIEALEAYRERYRPVARLAGFEAEFDAAGALDIVEDHVGVGSTDFWGISFAASSFEQGPMPAGEIERKLALLQAAWRFFDDVAARVSAEMAKGPRGGGRDRDEIVAHVFRNEEGDFGRRVGVHTPEGAIFTDDGLRTHRANFLAGIRDHNAEGKKAGRSWTVPFLIRHTAFHALDHAWEMEDKDLA